MNIYEILSRDNYLTVNKHLMKSIGLQEAVLLSELCYRRQYLDRSDKLTEDGFFYATVEDVEEETALSDYNQRKILERFQAIKLVEVERRGMPAKRFIRIDEQVLLFLMDFITCSENCTVPEDFKNLFLNNSVLNNNNTNNKSRTIVRDRVSGNSPASSSTETSSSETPFPISEEPKSKPISGKLVSSPKTRKSITQKVNSFIRMCEREAALKGYPDNLQRELQKFFIMLGESSTLLPQTTIKEQLAALDKLSAEKRVEAVRGTLQHGWKSLVYMCDELSGKNHRKNDPAFIGNSQPKDINAPRVSREEQLRKAIENGEEVF